MNVSQAEDERASVVATVDGQAPNQVNATGVEIEVDRDGSVSVSDRGPGIPEAQRALLFRRFWRADRRQSGGAGLGLAIAFRIAAAHAGQLVVSDNPGGGARFVLRIPLVG